MDDLILGRYRLEERLAVGGTAEVWRAQDMQLDRTVAVKRLHAHLLPDKASRRRLAAEARAAAQLSHPGIAEIYDVDAEGEAPAIVMELVDGESLASRVARDGPLPPDHAARLTADVADALYHAHQRGVVHRDVKPGNVLLSADGRTRLVDFGIARSLAESTERLTLTGTVIGTLSAMAPEQLAGGPIGPRTDLYGLGVVLHEALTGRPPYAETSPLALAEAQQAGPPALDGLEPTLGGLVAACLAPRPEDRPVHAGALARALRSWLAGDPGPARLIGRTAVHRRVVDTAAVTEPLPRTPAAPYAVGASPTSRRRWAVPVVVALLAILGTAAALSVSGLLDWPTAADPAATSSDVGQSPDADPASSLSADGRPQLRGWARDLAEDYEDECGEPLDPARIAGMNKRQAEEAIEPEIEACEEASDD